MTLTSSGVRLISRFYSYTRTHPLKNPGFEPVLSFIFGVFFVMTGIRQWMLNFVKFTISLYVYEEYLTEFDHY